MVKVLEAKHSSRKCRGRGRGGLPGLARLRHECHRFREEVLCIRTFPRLQLRWPSLARLEISNESSEEDASSVWDAPEAERRDTLFIGTETQRVAEARPGNVVEFSSPKLAPLQIASKAHESTSDEKLGGFEEKERSLQDVQSRQKMDDLVVSTLGCEDVAGSGMCCYATIEDDALESQGPSDGTSESKMAHQMLELPTTFQETSDPSDDGSLMDSLNGQTLNTVHTHSGARIAATALFTANPHHNSHEPCTGCSSNCNFTCQSERFKLVAFPGSNASDNASRKEREICSVEVVCSSFESHICSSSELNGFATVDKRNQTSTPIETNSLEGGCRTFDESSHTFQANGDMRLLSALPPVGPSSSDVDYEWEDRQAKIGLKGPETCVAPVGACHFLTEQDQNVLENLKQNGLAIQRTNNLEDCGMLTSLGGNSSRTAVDHVQSRNLQIQNGLAEGKQTHEVVSTDGCGPGRRLSTTFVSGLAQTSSSPCPNSLQHDYSPRLFNETGRPSSSKKQGNGFLDLISLSGMNNFARLGVGSTRDSVMTAQMAKRIKHALERLGEVGSQGQKHRKSVSIKKGKWTDEISAKWRNNSEATSESAVVKSDLKRFRNPDELLSEKSENKRCESLFLSSREHDEQNLGHGQITRQKCEAKSLTPEEPDLYLQSVIAALDSTYGSDVRESTLKASTSATELQLDQHGPTQGSDGGVSTKLSKTHANGTTVTTLGEVFQSHANKDCVADNRILHTTDVALPDNVLEEKYSADYVNSIRELISRPYHTDEEQDTVLQDCGVSAQSTAHANGSPSSTRGEVFQCDSEKDCIADNRILRSPNVEGTDILLQGTHSAIDVCSMGELIPHTSHTDEKLSAEVSAEDLPAFTVQIKAPPGSCFQVEVGGHPTVYGEVEDASQLVSGNPIICSRAHSGRQGKFNVRVAHRKSGLLQQRAIEHAPLTRQERHAGPISYDRDPLSASNKVEEGRQTKQASLSVLEPSPPVNRHEDSMSPKYSPTLRSSTNENLRHSFDQKITRLVKKANQIQEATKLPGTSTHKRRGSVCCRRQVEVIGPKRQPDSMPSTKVSDTFRDGDSCYEGQGPTKHIVKGRDRENKGAARATQSMVKRAQRPSIVRTSVSTKSLRLDSSTHANHRDSPAAQTATKMQAFGAAAAGLAHELNVLMKDRRSGQNLGSQAPNKRKVAWASPEAYELGPTPTVKPSTSQPGIQSEPSKHKQCIQHPTTDSKSACPGHAAPSATQTVCDVRKTKEHRKEPLREQGKAPRRPQILPKISIRKNSEFDDAVSASPLAQLGKKQVSQETGLRSEQAESGEGETRATKVPEAPAAETFDYDQFRQELKDLQVERMKLESLVHTIFTTDADPDRKTEDNLARHVQKNPDSTVKSARRDLNLDDHDKRKGLGLSPTRDSGKNGSHHAVKTGVRQRECGPTLSWVTLSDDSVGKKITRNSQAPVDRKTNDRVGSTLEQEEEIKRTPSASFPSGEALKSHRKYAMDVPDKCQHYRELSEAGSDTQLQEKDQNIGFNGKLESETHLSGDLGFSSKDVLERFPNLTSILAGEDGRSATRSASAASNMQVAKPDYFKEYLLQALDSSILLLQHCVGHSEELQDPAIPNRPESSNVQPSTDLVSKITERILENNSNVPNCTEGPSERTTEANVADATMKVQARYNEPDHSQEHVNKLGPNVQWLQQDECHLKGEACQQMLETRIDPRKSAVPSQQTLDSGEPQLENTLLETRKGFEHSQDSDSKVSSSEKNTSWSGSVKSVMEAYEEAQRRAALLISHSPGVYESNGRPPSSCRSDHSGKSEGTEKPKLQIEGTLKRKENVGALTLLEKAEAKELGLRIAQKKYVKSKQNSLRSTGLGGGKEKFQGQSKKNHSGREQWKVPKLIYRTAEFGTKRKDDWNDSTEVSYDKHGTGWDTNAKEASQALITKVLNEEFVLKQRRLGKKNSKPLEADMRRKRKDPVNLESYASTIAQLRVSEKPSSTKGNPPIADKCEAEVIEGSQDNVHTERSTRQLSMERNATDRVNYFTISRNLLETGNHVLDESTMVFKRSRESAGQRSSRSGGNLMNQDVRESIEHWLDTSGGFEFLDSYNEAVEKDLFERQESTNSMQRDANTFSMMTGLSERNLSDESPLDKLSFPSSAMEGRRLSTFRTTVFEKVGNSPSGDLGSIASSANGSAIQCSRGKHEEFPDRVGAGHEDDHAGGCSAHSSRKMGKSSLGCSFSISKGSASDQIVRVFPSQQPEHTESIHGGQTLLYSKDRSRLGGSRSPSQGDYTTREDAHALSPRFDVNEAHSDSLVQGTDFEEKWTEEEELQLALLEIVLQTIQKDDPLSETVATMTCGLPSAPVKRGSSDSSVAPTIACASSPCSVLPALTRGVTPMSIRETGSRSEVHLDQGVQTAMLDLPSLAFPTQEHAGDSAKSSGGDWPEYKCLAEMQSGSQSLEEDEHWPEYSGVDDVEDGVDHGTHIEELPFHQISTPSTSEVDADEKLPGRSLPPRAVPLSTRPSTRPPYSAVHSIRAAERQSIDFPGIASLAFGYPSPRPPPPSKPIGQTSVDTSSVSVQTADMSMTQSAPLSTSICVVPYCYLPPYSMYLSPSPPSAVPSPASTVPMTVAGQPGSQFISSQYAAGVVPIFPPQFMFPPSAPFPQVVSQTSVMPVAPAVQRSQQTQLPSCTVEDAQTTSSNPGPSPLGPSATEGPSQPSTAVKSAPTSTKRTSLRAGKHFVDVSEDSRSSSESCRSSLATPSTILSSPEHESRVASALARPRIARGVVGQLFDEGSSDDTEACGREEVSQTMQDGGTQPSDQGTHLPPYSTTVKEAEDPLLQSIIAEKSYKKSRNEIAPALDSLPTHMASASEFVLNQHAGRSVQPEPGTSDSVDTARSSVLVASYDGSGSSEGSVKRTRPKASMESSGQSSLDGFRQFKHRSPKPAGQVGFSQTSSRSSGEILGACGISLHGLDENQKTLRRHFSSRTLPLSEGEVEAGQMPSEGEYFGPIPYARDAHPRLLVNRRTGGRDIISEPGEICKLDFMQLRPPRSEIGGGDSSISEVLSEGELRVERSTEPGEVRATGELPVPKGYRFR